MKCKKTIDARSYSHQTLEENRISAVRRVEAGESPEAVIAVAILKTDVAPGWVTLSLQQSGMFFLLSLVLLVLGEYILHMVNLSNEGPLYHVGQEFTSVHMTRREKLNIENATVPLSSGSHSKTQQIA